MNNFYRNETVWKFIYITWYIDRERQLITIFYSYCVVFVMIMNSPTKIFDYLFLQMHFLMSDVLQRLMFKDRLIYKPY